MLHNSTVDYHTPSRPKPLITRPRILKRKPVVVVSLFEGQVVFARIMGNGTIASARSYQPGLFSMLRLLAALEGVECDKLEKANLYQHYPPFPVLWACRQCNALVTDYLSIREFNALGNSPVCLDCEGA